jgi:hypothetical protein
MSVILVSLAMFGVWCFIKDLWSWLLRPQLLPVPSVTFLLLVQNMEQEVEGVVRYLMREMADTDVECDAVVVDCNSDDLTAVILTRLVYELPGLQVCRMPEGARSVGTALPLCRGSVIHVMDMVHRLNSDEFMITVCNILQRDLQEFAIRQRD